MSIKIVSYSFTDNNKTLAAAVAKELSADFVQVTEKKHRKTGTIILDAIFQRIPKVSPSPSELAKGESILFIAPVWMGKAASPLRPYLKYLQKHPLPYAFASISGGALNPNPGLADDLQKWSGAKPAALIDLHIADLLPADPKPTMKDTSAYRLSGLEAEKMAKVISDAVKKAKLV